MTFPHATGTSRESYWTRTAPPPEPATPPLAEDARADVAVIGGGIAGLTTAHLLAKAGKSVIVLDRERLAMAETGHTTAHLQLVVDTRLRDLVARFGMEGAKLAWDSQLDAIRLIEDVASEESISCDLERVDAYLHSPTRRDARMLEDEVRLARDMGYAAEMADPADVPFECEAAIRFPDQGKFHARKYALGLQRALERRGARVHEGTEVARVDEGQPARVVTRDGHAVTADWVVHATNVPIVPRVLLQTKLYAYRTYAIGARVPRGLFQNALYWDTHDPYHYARVEPGRDTDYVILGGEDHKVGIETDTSVHWGALAEYLRTATSDYRVEDQWSGEVIETQDDLPYIGHLPGRGPNELVITGDSGTGMTNGTIGALIVAERILGRGTPWDDLYDPSRVTGGAKPILHYARHRIDETKRYLRTLSPRIDGTDVADIAPGQGAVVRRGLRAIAVHRDATGNLHCVNAACTHLGCTVTWNGGESSWDCPCHGSRFDVDGGILHGPAAEPLEPVPIDDVVDAEAAAEHGTKGP